MAWGDTASLATRWKIGEVVVGREEEADGPKPSRSALLPVARRAEKRRALARGSFSGCSEQKADWGVALSVMLSVMLLSVLLSVMLSLVLLSLVLLVTPSLVISLVTRVVIQVAPHGRFETTEDSKGFRRRAGGSASLRMASTSS